MDQLKISVVTALREYFPDRFFSTDKLTVLHQGRFANAIVFHYQDDDQSLVIKDYSHCPWVIKHTIGRFFIAREAKALKRLQGMSGVTLKNYKLSQLMLAYAYIEGVPLAVLKKQRKRLSPAFFHEMEKMVRKMHRRGVVHLDLRNLGNILYGKDGRPYFIDFQSSLRFSRLPRRLRTLMRGTDLSGVYKAWVALCDESLPSQKRRFLDGYNDVRKLWVFKGYPLSLSQREERELAPSDLSTNEPHARF